MSRSDLAAPELAWAERVSRRMLGPLGARWRHTLGVVERARAIGGVLEQGEADVLVAAAYLHDIGYAPELSRTGFHPLDGARFVRGSGHDRLADLVAYHSGAEMEADERGLSAEHSEFQEERSLLSRALTYCDLTTDPEGRQVEPAGRLEEICRRYGPQAPEARALTRARKTLLDDVRMVESALAVGSMRASAAASNAGRRR